MLECHRVVVVSLAVSLAVGCGSRRGASAPRTIPTPSVQVGACAEPGRDGVMSPRPSAERVDRADRDLDGDGAAETIVVDRAMCTPDGNCYWNVFRPAGAGPEACARYAGTFSGATLEPLGARGDDNMQDVRGYWSLTGGRLLLQSYRFVRGGYQLVDALLCRRAADDKLECTDAEG